MLNKSKVIETLNRWTTFTHETNVYFQILLSLIGEIVNVQENEHLFSTSRLTDMQRFENKMDNQNINRKELNLSLYRLNYQFFHKMNAIFDQDKVSVSLNRKTMIDNITVYSINILSMLPTIYDNIITMTLSNDLDSVKIINNNDSNNIDNSDNSDIENIVIGNTESRNNILLIFNGYHYSLTMPFAVDCCFNFLKQWIAHSDSFERITFIVKYGFVNLLISKAMLRKRNIQNILENKQFKLIDETEKLRKDKKNRRANINEIKKNEN